MAMKVAMDPWDTNALCLTPAEKRTDRAKYALEMLAPSGGWPLRQTSRLVMGYRSGIVKTHSSHTLEKQPG